MAETATSISDEGRVRSMKDGIHPSGYAQRKPRMTQADHIRSMSDEELAEWLTSITDDAQSDAKSKCDYQWSEWLQSEVEE